MRRYSPYKAPERAEWLSTDEQERIALCESYHRRKGIHPPNPMLHAAFHAIIENQVALGETVVVETLARLQDDGLDRHDAIHAIGSVLAEHVYDLFGGTAQAGKSDANEEYLDRLKVLTAKSWLRSG